MTLSASFQRVTLPAWWQKTWWGRAEGAGDETGGWRGSRPELWGPGEAEAAGMTAGSNITRAWKSADCLVALTWAQGQTREFREAPDTLRCLEQSQLAHVSTTLDERSVEKRPDKSSETVCPSRQ